MGRIFGTAVLSASGYTIVILTLFVAALASNVFNIPLLLHGACALWAAYLLILCLGADLDDSALNHTKPPSDIFHNGLGFVVFAACVTLNPRDYTTLAQMPWPVYGSLLDFIRTTKSGLLYVFQLLSFLGLFAAPLIIGVGLMFTSCTLWLLMAFGKVDPAQFERPEASSEPSYYDLMLTIQKLEKSLSTVEGERDQARAQASNSNRDLEAFRRTETALRQELVRSETSLHVIKQQNSDITEELAQERDKTARLKEALADLEKIVLDLRARVHAQKPAQRANPKPSNATNPADALKDIIDPTKDDPAVS